MCFTCFFAGTPFGLLNTHAALLVIPAVHDVQDGAPKQEGDMSSLCAVHHTPCSYVQQRFPVQGFRIPTSSVSSHTAVTTELAVDTRISLLDRSEESARPLVVLDVDE